MNSTEPNSCSVPPRIVGISEVRSFLKRCATIFKMAGVVLLILLLLAPLMMIRSVLQERLSRRNETVANITSSWGSDQTIVGPVLPKISTQLKGADFYTWVVSAYLVTSTAAIPVYGKLSDFFGRQPAAKPSAWR